jgi:hypothetical protein
VQVSLVKLLSISPRAYLSLFREFNQEYKNYRVLPANWNSILRRIDTWEGEKKGLVKENVHPAPGLQAQLLSLRELTSQSKPEVDEEQELPLAWNNEPENWGDDDGDNFVSLQQLIQNYYLSLRAPDDEAENNQAEKPPPGPARATTGFWPGSGGAAVRPTKHMQQQQQQQQLRDAHSHRRIGRATHESSRKRVARKAERKMRKLLKQLERVDDPAAQRPHPTTGIATEPFPVRPQSAPQSKGNFDHHSRSLSRPSPTPPGPARPESTK